MLDAVFFSGEADIKDKRLIRSFSYINGKWHQAASGEALLVSNPATGAHLGEVAALSCDA